MTYCLQDKDYRPCVGMIILNNCNQIFMARRGDVLPSEPFAWQMPQGGIDDGESAQQASMRELLEEVGTNNVALLSKTSDWLYYNFPADLMGNKLAGKYKGQKQRWFLYRFIGDDKEINLATDHPEFSDWKWCDPSEILEMVIPFKRQVYQDALREFSPFFDNKAS